jgi:Tfp pilus assembly PilM family ATPase
VTGRTLAGRAAAWLRRTFVDPPAPLAAIEVRARAVGAVRLVADSRGRSVGAAASVELPEGTLELSLSEANVAQPDAFRSGLRSVMEKAGILGGGRVALVLPDPVARVALLPAAQLKGRGRADSEEMVRFRLRKAVPFEIRDARVVVTSLPTSGGEPQVLVGVILRKVLEEYEGVCRGLGLEPGLVYVAGLAILDAVEAGRPPADRLLVNWDDGYVSILLARNGAPALIRTLTGVSAASAEHVAREAAQTVLYYRERLGGAGLAEAIVRSASIPVAEAAQALEEPLGVRPTVLDPWGPLLSADHAAAQALAGAAAAVVGKAA